jgi:hypothetical protein
MWFAADVIGLFSHNVVSFSHNAVPNDHTKYAAPYVGTDEFCAGNVTS